MVSASPKKEKNGEKKIPEQPLALTVCLVCPAGFGKLFPIRQRETRGMWGWKVTLPLCTDGGWPSKWAWELFHARQHAVYGRLCGYIEKKIKTNRGGVLGLPPCRRKGSPSFSYTRWALAPCLTLQREGQLDLPTLSKAQLISCTVLPAVSCCIQSCCQFIIFEDHLSSSCAHHSLIALWELVIDLKNGLLKQVKSPL